MFTLANKKIAMVFTGAVSLGSFEAGVAHEIVTYLQQQKKPEFEIDVIVGTSAGALTGALMALILAFGLDPSILEEAWKSVKLEDLLKLRPQDQSLLSSSKLEDIIGRYIAPPEAGQVGSRLFTEAIKLAVVVTNLDGVKYNIHQTRHAEFAIKAIGYEDSLGFEIGRDFNEWERLREAVRASSAFPGAFEHKKIMRINREFRKKAKYNFTNGERRHFNYADGGIVNNQPLNMAIEIAGDLPDDNPGCNDERLFLVVDPCPPALTSEGNGDFDLFDVVGKAVWTIPRNQTLYKDLLLLEKVNRRIQWKNSFISTLADIWNFEGPSPDQSAQLDRLCNEVAAFKGSTLLGMDPAQYLEYEQERIKRLYDREIGKTTNGESFTKYCFLLEQIADLRNKKAVNVEMINPQNPEQELAGVIFGSFGGFLDTGFIAHDYEVGRSYARRWLKTELDLHRSMRMQGYELNPGVQRKFIQGIFDNFLPILIDHIAPRMFNLKDDFGGSRVSVFTLIRIAATSLVKYFGRKTVDWALGRNLFK